MEKFHVNDNFEENHEKYSFWDFKGKYDYVDTWFLMGTPYPLLGITAVYLLFVLKLGPEYLKNRKPYQLKNVLLIYNAAQVVLSVWMVSRCAVEVRKVGIVQRTCMTDTEESKLSFATLTYYYFSCKIAELLDTIFFVLRKKQNQVTFLHVYHHTFSAWFTWAFLKYDPGYWMLFLGLLNCSVHVVMYAYYGLSAYPSLQKYLWWKKYITSLQLIQFGLTILQITVNFFVNECKPSSILVFLMYFNLLLFVYLFTSFYKRKYTQKNMDPDISKNSNNTLLKTTTVHKNGGSYKNGDYYPVEDSKDYFNDIKSKIKSY